MKLINLQRKISLMVVLAIITSGLVVSLMVASPLINQLYQQSVELTRSSVALKSAHLQQVYEQQLAITKQISSRSRIAYKMRELAQGEVTLSQARDYIQPKLKHAIDADNSILALMRLDQSGQEVVRINAAGVSVPDFTELDTQFDFLVINSDRDADPLATSRVVMPIKLDDQTLGYDVVIFKPKPWVSSLSNQPSAATCFIQVDSGYRVALNDQQLSRSSAETCVRTQGELEVLRPNDAYLITLDSGERIVSYDRDIGIPNWKLVISVPVPIMFKSIIEELVWGIIAIIMLTLLFSWAGLRVIKPLTKKLAAQSKAIAQSANELKVANLAFEQSEGLFLITTADLMVYRCNRSFAAFVNQLPRNLYKKPFLTMLDKDHCDPQKFGETIQQENAWQGEVWITTSAESSVPCLLTASPVRDEQNLINYYVMTFTDIRDRIAEQEALTAKINYDALTQLLNRSAFDRFLEQRIHQARLHQNSFAVLFMDLDKFKPVNDSYGHDAGDELLRQVATRLQSCLRDEDLIARRGGDEFVVCTSYLQNPTKQALKIAKKIHAEMNRPFDLTQAQVTIGISIGIALYPAHGDSAELLLKAADEAMYSVKNRQRNNIQLHPG